MIDIDKKCPVKSIVPFVKNWFQLLSMNRFEEACKLLDEPNCYGLSWDRDNILELLNDTFSEGTYFRKKHPDGPIFTDPFDCGDIREIEVEEFNDGIRYSVEYDIPLNGEISDLTAQFEFRKRNTGYAVILHDMHVM